MAEEKEIIPKKLAVFASGSGSNAQKIFEYFEDFEDAEVSIVLSNNPDAYVLERADNFEIPTQVFSWKEFYETENILDILKKLDVDMIALAGFLWLVPNNILKHFPNKIVNLHPAILPKFGGKGMYGKNVHEAVLQSGDVESGITIHYVNENYDEGEIIAQYYCPVEKKDSVEALAFKIQQLEHNYFPKAVYNLLHGKTVRSFSKSSE